MTFWIRRTPPGSRVSNEVVSIQYHLKSSPPTPPARPKHRPKIRQKPSKFLCVQHLFGINFLHQFFDTAFSGYFQILVGFWLPFWIRRTPPGSRVSNYLQVNPLSRLSPPLPPRHGPKIESKSAKIAEILFLPALFCIKFLHQFFDTFFCRYFQILVGFWLPFWIHFGIIFHTFCITFSGIDFASILYRLFVDF